MSQSCRVCGTITEGLIDFGMQPYSNRYLHSCDEPEERFHLQVVTCGQCGLVQLAEPPPPGFLRPRVDWIRYNEPEGHLDEVAQGLAARLADRREPYVLGISYKDSSLVERLLHRGCGRGDVLASEDFLVTDEHAGIETIQEACTADVARRIRERRGAADVVVARHILEHAQDQRGFLAAVRLLMQPDGLLVLEVPDATRSLADGDYSTIWEEHVVYFTARHLRLAVEAAGFTDVEIAEFPYPLENSLVLVCRAYDSRDVQAGGSHFGPEWGQARELARRYGSGFEARRADVAAALDELRSHGHRVAVFGAGHLCVKFVNLLGLEQRIELVIDDNPRKKGMFLPGSRLPIVGSERLLADDGPDVCLSSLSPESEERVLAKLGVFLDRGGRFASIFPASHRSFVRAGKHGEA
jgi:hypothetical protein